jgi:chromosome segregation ATPase
MDKLFLEGQLRSALALREFEDAAQFRAELAELTSQQIGLEEELSQVEHQFDEWNHLQRQCARLEESLKRHDLQIAAIEKDIDFAHASREVTLTHLSSVWEKIARLESLSKLRKQASGEDWADEHDSIKTETI